MVDHMSPQAIVVGIDGTAAAHSAAIWAAGEAAVRNLPLRLVYVIHSTGGPDDPPDPASAAAAALDEARRAAWSAAGITAETEALRGNPLATLIELSHTAAMIAVGSVGIAHTCHRAGSTAAALAGSAGCPVAVIRSPDTHQRTGPIVAEVDSSPDNRTVLGWATAEAKLRHVPLEVVTADDAAGYLAAHAESIQLFVSGTRDRRSLGWAGGAGGCSVLTVGGPPR